MGRRMEWVAREISGIEDASETQIVVRDAVTGVVVRLPRCEIDFGPRKVFISKFAWEKIYLPTVEKIARRS
jgi:hypothetical protein